MVQSVTASLYKLRSILRGGHLELNVLLLVAQDLSLCCLDLLLDQVQACDHLCHGVLHLQCRVKPQQIRPKAAFALMGLSAMQSCHSASLINHVCV